jgi:hypothetical protein
MALYLTDQNGKPIQIAGFGISNIGVYNGLDSFEGTIALSAYQGNVLNTKITDLNTNILTLADRLTSYYNKNETDLLLKDKASTSDIPTKTSELQNDGDGTSSFATEQYVDNNGGKIDSISINGIKQTIDQTKNVNIEITEYDDTEINRLIDNKVDKEEGKGLSSNDYTTEEKTKLDTVINEVNNKLTLTGGTMSGALNIEGITNKEKAISIESPNSDAMISLTRTDVGNSIGVGIGGDGTARGIWDEALQKWLIMHDGSALKLNGSATRPKYNSNDLALYSDVTNLGRFVNAGSTSGTRYYPLVRFNKAINEGNNYSAVFLNGRIGGWDYNNSAYITAIFWGRDKRGGEYTSIGNIKSAVSRAEFVMYEESSTSVVLYLKINGYALARFSFSGSGEGVVNLYDGSYITSTPTGTLIASMSNGTIPEKKDADILYDMSSSSSSINWGKTAGIKGGEKVSGKDFSKYSFLRVTAANYDIKVTYFVDLKKVVPIANNSSYPYVGSVSSLGSKEMTEIHYSLSVVNTAKTEFYYALAGYLKGTTWNGRHDNTNYYISKIEGVI